MKFSAFTLFFPILLMLSTSVGAQNLWQQVTVPSVREAASSFAKPPSAYGAIHWAIWGGQQSKEKIVKDIKQMQEVTFIRHVYRSSPTRFVNREDGTNDKDSRYSLIDYLDAEATRTYLKIIFDAYEKLVGDEFGKTILGFRGDEPDYTGLMPWTPKLLETFQIEKGYDLRPWIAQFFTGELSAEAKRVKADYWDVWSGMFRDNFFKPMRDWCRARNMDYMMHLNHEELMLNLSRGGDLFTNEGSLFRGLRYAGVPGIDSLSQIKPGAVTDFPKLASSA